MLAWPRCAWRVMCARDGRVTLVRATSGTKVAVCVGHESIDREASIDNN